MKAKNLDWKRARQALAEKQALATAHEVWVRYWRKTRRHSKTKRIA